MILSSQGFAFNEDKFSQVMSSLKARSGFEVEFKCDNLFFLYLRVFEP